MARLMNYFIKKCKYGKGVFAGRVIKKGEKIFTMDGERISKNKLTKVSDKGRDIFVDPLQIDDNTFINLIEPYLLVNHSCNPNTGFKKGRTLYAIKNIKKNEEILYDYSSTWFEAFKCRCGENNCRGHIGGFLTIPEKTRKKYFRLGIVPEFIRKKFRR